MSTPPAELPCSVRIEQPLRSNAALNAVDEASGTIVLADFCLSDVSRIVFSWPLRCSDFNTSTAAFVDTLGLDDLHFVRGWSHDATGTLRMRHKVLASNLRALGWDACTQPGSGIATRRLEHSLLMEIEHAVAQGCGWFLTIGKWATSAAFSQQPYYRTMASFCWARGLRPSAPFLNAIGQTGGAIAYTVTSDDGPPGIVFVIAESNRRLIDGVLELADAIPRAH